MNCKNTSDEVPALSIETFGQPVVVTMPFAKLLVSHLERYQREETPSSDSLSKRAIVKPKKESGSKEESVPKEDSGLNTKV